MAALGVLFPLEDGSFNVACGLWAQRVHLLHGPWKAYAEQGYIQEIAAYEPLAASVRLLATENQLVGVAYDAWEVKDFLLDLAEDGLPIKDVRKGWHQVSLATKEILRLKKEQKLHFVNPALSEMFEAVILVENWEGDCKIDVRRSGAVGGVQALVTAMLLYLKDVAAKAS